MTLSREAVRRGDTDAALDRGPRRARHPALGRDAVPPARARRGADRPARLPAERGSARRSTASEIDWRLWLVQARIQTKRGEIAAARRSLDRARELNPRSPLLRPNAVERGTKRP